MLAVNDYDLQIQHNEAVELVNLQEGLFRAEVADWRAVVDCVLIDTDYQGEVFTITLADVPERKPDLVQGRYQLPAPPAGARVAVKIIDMLGEELLIEQVPRELSGEGNHLIPLMQSFRGPSLYHYRLHPFFNPP